MRDVASIVGLDVVASKQGRRVGKVSEVVVDLSDGEVVGLIVGEGAAEKGILADDIEVVGTDAVMVETSKVAKPLSEYPPLIKHRGDPGETTKEVVTDSGKRLGTLGKVYTNTEELTVTVFEISGGPWRDFTDGVRSMPITEGIVDGRDTVVVPENVVRRQPSGEGGLKDQIASIKEVAQKQAQQASESLEKGADEMKEGVQKATEQASESLEKGAGEMKEGVQKATQQAKQAAEELAEEPEAQKPDDDRPATTDSDENESESAEDASEAKPAEPEDEADDDEEDDDRASDSSATEDEQ